VLLVNAKPRRKRWDQTASASWRAFSIVFLTSQQQQLQQDLGSPQADMESIFTRTHRIDGRKYVTSSIHSRVRLSPSPHSPNQPYSSPIPFLLLHLPPIDTTITTTTTTSLDSVSEQAHPTTSLGPVGVWCNPALVGTQGLLKGRLEVRWERHYSRRPALWWDGDRLPSWIPDMILTRVDVHALDAELDVGTSL